MKKLALILVLALAIIIPLGNTSAATSIAERVKGRIVLQVQSHGEAWYVYPDNLRRYSLGRPAQAFDIMRALGLGITNANLAKIPKNTDSWTGDMALVARLRGKILLQVQSKGEAWYLSPTNGKRYFLGRPSDAFNVMRSLGLGITNSNLSTITIGTISVTPTPEEPNPTPNPPTEESSESITVSTVNQLENAVNATDDGGKKTILIENGTYTLNSMLWIPANGVTIRSRSGNREAVILQGQGMNGSVTHIFNVDGNNFIAKDMTLRRVANHAIQLQVGIDNFTAQNLHVLDTGEQMIKAAYDAGNMSASSDNGLVEDCLFEYSAGIGPQYYIGGVDAHNAKNWIVRRNTFKNIRSPSDDVAEYTIHFWSDSENTLVERNLIINCDRGIGFGMGDRGHEGGIIRNNMIYHNATEGFADVGIGLESTRNAQVYNNTVFMENSYPNAIEYRFTASSGITLYNNLTNKDITSRDGGSATLSNNVTSAAASWFIGASSGNLRLKSTISGVADAGRAISGLTNDFDGENRPKGSGIDIGADEF